MKTPRQEKLTVDHNQKEEGDPTEVMAMCHQHQPERHVIGEKKNLLQLVQLLCLSLTEEATLLIPTPHLPSYQLLWRWGLGGEREGGESIQSL